MAFIGLGNSPTFSNAGSNFGINPNAAAQALADPQMREVALGQIATAIIVKAVLSFDDPVTTQSQSPGGGGSQNTGSSGVQNAPGYNGSGSLGSSLSNRPPDNQTAGSANFTQQGGLSFGGGVRLAGGGAPTGFSAAGSTTLNSSGYQTSGGFSALGFSANAGVKINQGGVQFSGNLGRAQVGQGLVGDKVGPRIVGP